LRHPEIDPQRLEEWLSQRPCHGIHEKRRKFSYFRGFRGKAFYKVTTQVWVFDPDEKNDAGVEKAGLPVFFGPSFDATQSKS